METESVAMPRLKRFFDIFFAGLILAALAPFLLVIFVALAAERLLSPSARGPFFYCEPRVSGGRVFRLCKLRVCRQAVIDKVKREKGFVHTAEVESKRKNFLAIGWLVKKIYLDEWPQLWSVLKGDMSLVGPRPPNLENYEKLLAQKIYTKSAIKAGLTGPFQSCKGNQSESDVIVDQRYIDFCRAHSALRIVWNDFKILLRTLRVILEHKGV